MISDDERREVARRLRELEKGVIGAFIPTRELAEGIIRAIDYGRSGAMTPYGCLADLIEPSCDRDAPQKVAEEMFGKMRHSTKEEADAYEAMLKSMSVEIHPVDREALLALADEMDRHADIAAGHVAYAARFDFAEWARRIREALGVES